MLKKIPAYVLPLAAALAVIIDPTPAVGATLAEACDNLNREACAYIARQTDGECASPGGLGGCRYDSLQTY